MKPPYFPAVPERAEEDHDFAGKIREAGKTDRSEHAESESEPGERHYPGEPAKLMKRQCAGAFAQLAGDSKQQRD